MDEGQVIFQVDSRKMKVTLAIAKPDDIWEEPVLPEDLEEYLSRQGVVYGVDHNALVHLATGMIYDKEIVVAQGREPINGTDGYYEYFVALEDMRAKPVVAADGTVDYLNSLKIAMVEEGDRIAEYHPATKGTDGINVMGERLPAVAGKNLPALKGKGILEREEEHTFVARATGRIFQDGKRICIDPTYVVQGDLDIGHGNIKFNGDVVIQGDMHSGLLLEAGGSVFIKGHVGNCKITAGQNVTIGEGIQGKYGCEIVAGGDVTAKFVEHCTISTRGNVYANSLMNSIVESGESVVVTSEDGKIIGGNIRALQSIWVRTLGNEAGVRTRLTFGETGDLHKKVLSLKERRKKVQADLQVLNRKFKELDAVSVRVMGPESAAVKRQISQAKILRQTEEIEVTKEITAVEEQIKKATESANVRVEGVLHSGVVISSDGAVLIQKQPIREAGFMKRSNHIVMVPKEECERS